MSWPCKPAEVSGEENHRRQEEAQEELLVPFGLLLVGRMNSEQIYRLDCYVMEIHSELTAAMS